MTYPTVRLARKPSGIRNPVAPTTLTRILFDATRTHAAHNVTGRPTRHARTFGAGLLAFVPASSRVSYTAADEAEYMAMVRDREIEEQEAQEEAAREYNIIMDERAEAAWELERGCEGSAF